MKEIFYLVQKVHISEKASLLGEKQNQYVFRVHPEANKIELKNAIERLFKKHVLAIRTMQYAGKKKRERRADFGRRAHWKKAIISLAPGDKIDLT
ncbi:MAG: 50S ribosomal protein L23 [Chthoniobacterales bacterium]|nr:50S ribosomal protein L23 [Chthoniobacterales bacterium]